MAIGDPWRQQMIEEFERWYTDDLTMDEFQCRKRLAGVPLSSRFAVFRQVESALVHVLQHTKVTAVAGGGAASGDGRDLLIAKLSWLREEIGPLS